MVGLNSQTAVLPAGGSFTARLELRDCFSNRVPAGEEHCDMLQVSHEELHVLPRGSIQVFVDSEAFYEIEPTTSLPQYVQVNREEKECEKENNCR